MLSATSPTTFKYAALAGSVSRSLHLRKATAVKAEKATCLYEWKRAVESISKPVVLGTVSSLVLTLPAYAEAGKLFDFNLTLPVMAGQFLLLMFFLDKTWFSPVGDMLDKRDKIIRDQLANVSGRREEIEKLEKDAEEILRKARAESQASINKARGENEAANAEKFAAAKAISDKEITKAFEVLEREKETALKKLEPEVEALSAQVIKILLPAGVTL